MILPFKKLVKNMPYAIVERSFTPSYSKKGKVLRNKIEGKIHNNIKRFAFGFRIPRMN